MSAGLLWKLASERLLFADLLPLVARIRRERRVRIIPKNLRIYENEIQRMSKEHQDIMQNHTRILQNVSEFNVLSTNSPGGVQEAVLRA